jgi:antitoxin protein of toxin-antitoxin system
MSGFLDRVKGLVKEREGQIRSAVDKAGDFVDDKTKGKYHDKIAKAGEKADQVITKATADGAPADGSTPASDASSTDTSSPDTSGTDTSGTDTASQPTSEATETPADAPKDPDKDTDKGAAE